jgi:hypothetical protein
MARKREPKQKQKTPQPVYIPNFPPPVPQPADVVSTDGMVAVQVHDSAQVRLELTVLPAMSGTGVDGDNLAEILATIELAGDQIWYFPPSKKPQARPSPDPNQPRLRLSTPRAMVAPPTHLTADEHNQAVTYGAAVVSIEYLGGGVFEDAADPVTDEHTYPSVTPAFPMSLFILSQAQDAPDGVDLFADPDSSPVQLPSPPPTVVETPVAAPMLAETLPKVSPPNREPVHVVHRPAHRLAFLVGVCATLLTGWWFYPSLKQPDESVAITPPATQPAAAAVATATQERVPSKEVTRVTVSGVGAHPMCTAECSWGDLNLDGMPLTKNGRKTIVCGSQTYTAVVTRSVQKKYCWNATGLELVADSNTPTDSQTR